MKIRKIATIAFLVLSSFAANNVAPSKAELEAMYDKAFREFDANNFGEALKQLDAIDARQPDLAESQNLRGVILMRQNVYDKAEEALHKALDLDPKFWNARFNLAEIPFLQKNWAEARDRFEKLLTANASELQPEASQLIQYKILLTYLLEGKDNMVDSILSKFELSAETPAVQYAKAAIALQHKNLTEAKDWTTTAEKNFSPALNKLFAESLYEIGWLEKPVGQTRAALELTSTSERVARTRAYAKAKFEEAEQAFQQRDLAKALKALDEADGDPDQAPYLNLRGEIFMEKKDFNQAEDLFKKALRADPKFREAQYNLAQIPFKKKEYAKARDRLEALFNATPGGDKNQAAQLIKFKIFLTLLLEGKESRAQKMMEQFQFTGDTPALYYAQAAWEFSHKNPSKGNDWVNSAKKIYSPALNIVFADSFYDLGWLNSAPVSEAPASAAPFVAQAGTSPGEIGSLIEPSPIPGVTLPRSQPAPELESGSGGGLTLGPAPVIPGMEATTSSAQPPSSTANSSPVEIITAGTPGTTESSATAAQPGPSAPVTAAGSSPATDSAKTAEPTAPKTSAAPPIVADTSSPARSVDSAKGVPPLVATSSTSPATVMAPSQVREYSPSRITPSTFLFIGMILAGVLILGWGVRTLLRPASARGLSAMPVRGRTASIMEPRFQKAHPPAADEQRASNTRLAGGPPQLSVELKASEPSVRRATIPVGKLARTAAFVGEAAPAPVEVVDDLVYAGPEEKIHEIPVQETVDVDALSREAAGEVSEVFPIETAPSSDSFDVSADQEVEAEAEVEVPSEPTAEPPAVTPAWAAFEPDFSAVGEPVFTSEIAQPAWLDEPPTFASDEVIASVESAFGEHVEPASFEPAEVQNETTTFASEEVIASVESALGEDVEPATFESMEVQNVEVPEPELEPIAQGQPVPYQTPAEITEPEPEVSVAPAEGFFARAAALAGLGSLRPPVESPSLAPQVVSTDPSIQQLTTPATMPESTITPAPGIRIAPAAGASPATLATSAAQSAVQITFSFEIASMQLTSAFKMGTLQLKPISKVVAMRLAPSQHPQPAMNLQVTFEVSAVQLAGNAIGTIRLTPSQQQKPSVLTTPSFAIAGLQLVSGSESAPVQLTPSQQGQTSVHVTAAFQIATVEFSPTFEIASLILNSTSKRVSVQLPGAGPSAIESAPIFEMTNVQLTGSGDIGMVNLSPSAVAQRRV